MAALSLAPEGPPLDMAALFAGLEAQLPPYAAPRFLRLLSAADEIDLTITFKPRRDALAAAAISAATAGAPRRPPRDAPPAAESPLPAPCSPAARLCGAICRARGRAFTPQGPSTSATPARARSCRSRRRCAMRLQRVHARWAEQSWRRSTVAYRACVPHGACVCPDVPGEQVGTSAGWRCLLCPFWTPWSAPARVTPRLGGTKGGNVSRQDVLHPPDHAHDAGSCCE
eukprot:7387746-Prymnesium_polylepis.1